MYAPIYLPLEGNQTNLLSFPTSLIHANQNMPTHEHPHAYALMCVCNYILTAAKGSNTRVKLIFNESYTPTNERPAH